MQFGDLMKLARSQIVTFVLYQLSPSRLTTVPLTSWDTPGNLFFYQTGVKPPTFSVRTIAVTDK